ncbi:MAG: DNA internalization-related competence protein ComEC/Rec2 [Steroidobacteraceae bacterium]
MGASAIGLLAGVLAVLLAPGLATTAGLVAIACAGCVALTRRRVHWLAFFCAGFLCCHASAAPQLAQRQQLDERRLLAVRIASIPVREADLLRFDAELRDPREHMPAQRARVVWRLRDPARQTVPEAGDVWQLALKVRPPRAAVNPGAVDVERSLFRDRIDALGEVIDSPLNRRTARHSHTLLALRERIVRNIDTAVPERSAAALLAALAVGATGDVSREQWRIFNATGITHLVAISGLHVTLFAWLAMRATAWAWRYVALLGLRWRRDSVTAVAGIGAAWGYALLAGFSVPTQRTLVMLALFLLWRSRARAAPMSASLALSLVAVLVMDPFAPLGAGLWLSFGAVAAILLTAGTRLRPAGKLREFLLLQFWVTVALLPATLAVFGSVSLAGLLVNLAAIPLFSLVLVPLVLGAVALRLALPQALALLPDLLLRLAAWLVEVTWPAFAAAADWRFALWRAAPEGAEYLLAFAALAIVLCAWPLALRASTLLLLVPLASSAAAPARGGVDISVLDVGQGLAVLLRTTRHVLLYDTGDTFRSAGAPAERVLGPYAARLGVRALDLVVLPSLSIDAGAGVTALRGQWWGGRVIAGGPGESLPPEFEGCVQSLPWEWDGVRFELQSAANDTCVLRASGPAGAILLTGDIDAASERELLDRGLGRASVVIIPRHAAASASSPVFVEHVRARWAIASVRAGARESASYKTITQRWRAAGATVLDTASGGALRLRLVPGSVTASIESARARRFGAGTGLWRLP